MRIHTLRCICTFLSILCFISENTNILILINFIDHRLVFNWNKIFRQKKLCAAMQSMIVDGCILFKVYFISISIRHVKIANAIVFVPSHLFSSYILFKKKFAGIIIRPICTKWPFSMQFSTTHIRSINMESLYSITA